MPLVNYTQLNPNTSTREAFTSNITGVTIPSNASEEWKFYAENGQALLDKLAHHDAMAPNLQQTYMTPAASKNKVYFMWDFVGRTLVSPNMCTASTSTSTKLTFLQGFLYMLPPTTSSYSSMEDIMSRSAMAAMLILDEQPGMLDQMVCCQMLATVDSY